MVKEGDEADGGFFLESGGRGDGIDEARGAAVRHAQVVEASREDEFVVETTDAGFLGIVEDQFKIYNGGSRYTGGFSQ